MKVLRCAPAVLLLWLLCSFALTLSGCEGPSLSPVREAADNPPKLALAAPQGAAGKVADLELQLIGGFYKLQWTYVNRGDYDLNGAVGVSDITPIAMHFGADTDDGQGNDALESWVDGDGDGAVGISDITPIAMGFLSEVTEYYIMTSANEGGPYSSIGTVAFGDSSFPKAWDVFLPSGALVYTAVVPVSADLSAGELSNVVCLPAVNGVAPQSGWAESIVKFTANVRQGISPDSMSWDFGGGAAPNASTDWAPEVVLGSPGDYEGVFTLFIGTSSVTYPFSYTVLEPFADALPDSIYLLSDKSAYNVGETVYVTVYIYQNASPLANLNGAEILKSSTILASPGDWMVDLPSGTFFSGMTLLYCAGSSDGNYFDINVTQLGLNNEVVLGQGSAVTVPFTASQPGTTQLELVQFRDVKRTYYSDLSLTEYYFSHMGLDLNGDGDVTADEAKLAITVNP